MTDGIIVGIDRITGALTVSDSATSEVGGQRYQCWCGEESACYIIHSELHDCTCTCVGTW